MGHLVQKFAPLIDGGHREILPSWSDPVRHGVHSNTGKDSMADREFATYAWLLRGIGNTPGWLWLGNERLAFLTPDEVVFDVSRSQISAITFPWYYFSGGMRLTAAGQRYKIAFVLPNDAEYPQGSPLEPRVGLSGLALKGASLREGREVGRRWRELLSGSG